MIQKNSAKIVKNIRDVLYEILYEIILLLIVVWNNFLMTDNMKKNDW